MAMKIFAIKILENITREENGYRSKTEQEYEQAKRQIMRDTVDSKIKELKAMNVKRPASRRILRAAT